MWSDLGGPLSVTWVLRLALSTAGLEHIMRDAIHEPKKLCRIARAMLGVSRYDG